MFQGLFTSLLNLDWHYHRNGRSTCGQPRQEKAICNNFGEIWYKWRWCWNSGGSRPDGRNALLEECYTKIHLGPKLQIASQCWPGENRQIRIILCVGRYNGHVTDGRGSITWGCDWSCNRHHSGRSCRQSTITPF